MRFRTLGLLLVCAAQAPVPIRAEEIPVRHPEGLVHGFLALRSLDGRTLADGDLIQTSRGGRVTSRLILRFRDGSLHDETVVYSQDRVFRMWSDHLVQKGPSFEQPVDLTIDGRSGQVTVRYTEDGKEKTITERMELPTDLANGMVLTLMKNLRPDAPRTEVSMVVAAPKPRLVKLVITPGGEDPFALGGSRRQATRYAVKVQIGGIAGVLAPLVGKQPPDTHVWILGGEAPAFVKSEGPLGTGGPVWRLELVSPTWPPAPRTTP